MERMNIALASSTPLLDFFAWLVGTDNAKRDTDGGTNAMTVATDEWLTPSQRAAADNVLSSLQRADLDQAVELALDRLSTTRQVPAERILDASDEILTGSIPRLARPSERIVRVLGVGPSRNLHIACVHMLALIRAIVILEGRNVFAAAVNQPPHLENVFDVPLEVRSSVLRYRMASGALIVIARAAEVGVKLQPWIAQALVEHVSIGFHLDRIDVPDTPPTSALGTPQKLDDERLAQWIAEADKSGAEVYFPEGDIEDESR